MVLNLPSQIATIKFTELFQKVSVSLQKLHISYDVRSVPNYSNIRDVNVLWSSP